MTVAGILAMGVGMGSLSGGQDGAVAPGRRIGSRGCGAGWGRRRLEAVRAGAGGPWRNFPLSAIPGGPDVDLVTAGLLACGSWRLSCLPGRAGRPRPVAAPPGPVGPGGSALTAHSCGGSSGLEPDSLLSPPLTGHPCRRTRHRRRQRQCAGGGTGINGFHRRGLLRHVYACRQPWIRRRIFFCGGRRPAAGAGVFHVDTSRGMGHPLMLPAPPRATACRVAGEASRYRGLR